MKLRIAAVLAACTLAVPAVADVKAGVDAWSRGDYAKAVAEWRAPAIAGDADAQFNLGQAYKLGRGVTADLAQATEWFRKAAAQGHMQASDNYGLALFQDGKKAAALPWLEKSAARDEKRAQLVLGTMLFNGDGVPRDYVRAYALVTRSSQQGLPQGSQTLAQMDRYVPEAQRQQGIAMARRIEADARSAKLAAVTGGKPAPQPGTAALPPSKVPGASYGTPGTPAARPTPAPAATARPAPSRPAPAPASRPAAASPARGAWRVQLGAFSDPGNARTLWSRIGARVSGTPDYVRAGTITRLQATGFASRAEAQRACARAGTSCVVIAP